MNVAVPKNLNAHQKEALRAFARAMGEEAEESAGLFRKKKKNSLFFACFVICLFSVVLHK